VVVIFPSSCYTYIYIYNFSPFSSEISDYYNKSNYAIAESTLLLGRNEIMRVQLFLDKSSSNGTARSKRIRVKYDFMGCYLDFSNYVRKLQQSNNIRAHKRITTVPDRSTISFHYELFGKPLLTFLPFRAERKFALGSNNKSKLTRLAQLFS